jgi:hypothetical protein
MKKIAGVLVMVMSASFAWAQSDAINKLFSKYQADETFTQATISSKMFNLFTNMEVESKEDQEVLNAISKLKGLRMLAKEETRDARELYKEAIATVPAKEYEELMYVRDKDKDMKFFIRETSPGKINELIMVMGGNSEFMILSLFGEIDLKQVSKIGSKMDIGGLDELQKMDQKKDKGKSNEDE